MIAQFNSVNNPKYKFAFFCHNWKHQWALPFAIRSGSCYLWDEPRYGISLSFLCLEFLWTWPQKLPEQPVEPQPKPAPTEPNP